jgi:septum site-determining protein MinC
MAASPASFAQAYRVHLSESVDPLVVTVDRDASFETLRSQLRSLLAVDADRYRGVNAQFDLGERDLDLFDLRRLVHLAKDEFDVHVVSLRCHPRSVHRFAERELKLKIHAVLPDVPESKPVETPVAPPAAPPPVEKAPLPPPVAEPQVRPAEDLAFVPGDRAFNVRKTLRSGAVVRFGGDVIVYGDVNPGAQVIAGGSILVLGALKGMAHAGARGTEDGFILSFELRPTQLRIGMKIAIPPDTAAEGTGRPVVPEIAYVRENQIVIEPYRGRLPRTST